jgi:hypothetical protein
MLDLNTEINFSLMNSTRRSEMTIIGSSKFSKISLSLWLALLTLIISSNSVGFLYLEMS